MISFDVLPSPKEAGIEMGCLHAYTFFAWTFFLSDLMNKNPPTQTY